MPWRATGRRACGRGWTGTSASRWRRTPVSRNSSGCWPGEVSVSRTFDENELLDRVDNDWDFLAETVQMLEGDGRALVREMRRAAGSGDAPAVGRAAHTLKGMVSNFCSPAAHASALAVEQLGKGGDLSPAPPALDAVERDLNALIADLNEFVSTRTRCAS